MCGIAGVVGEVPNMKSLLKKMSQVQLHRGPDNMGSWISWVVDSEIGMIHNRLAVKQIKGVSEQPYMDEDTGLILVCDGNIYNHVELRKLLSRYYTFHFYQTNESSTLFAPRTGKRRKYPFQLRVLPFSGS